MYFLSTAATVCSTIQTAWGTEAYGTVCLWGVYCVRPHRLKRYGVPHISLLEPHQEAHKDLFHEESEARRRQVPQPSSQRERWQCQDLNVYLLILNQAKQERNRGPRARRQKRKWQQERKESGDQKSKRKKKEKLEEKTG